QIIDDDHALARGHAVDVDLDAVGAVLELVVMADRRVRQLARLADRYKADPERVGDRGAEDEAARFDRGHLVDLAEVAIGEDADHLTKAVGVCQQRSDVAKPDPRLGKVGDGANQLLEATGDVTDDAAGRAAHEAPPLRRTRPATASSR